MSLFFILTEYREADHCTTTDNFMNIPYTYSLILLIISSTRIHVMALSQQSRGLNPRGLSKDAFNPNEVYLRGNDVKLYLPTRISRKATSASISAFFLFLVWKTLSSFETASSKVERGVAMGLLAINMAGFMTNSLKPLNFKSYLKIILALNMIREWSGAIFNAYCIVFKTQNPGDMYIGRFFLNLWISFLCYIFSKSQWVLHPADIENKIYSDSF